MSSADLALARTIQLISSDFFGKGLGEDLALEAAIARGLRSTTIRIVANKENLASEAGQTVVVAMFGLVSMMGMGVDLQIPEMELLRSQPPLRGSELRSSLMSYGADLIPDARFGMGGAASADLTFVIGDTPVRDRSAIRLTGDAWRCELETEGKSVPTRWIGSWPFGALAAAAAGSAEALKTSIPIVSECADVAVPSREWFRLDHRRIELDLSLEGLPQAAQSLGEVDFVSGGAITFSAIYCLLRIPGLSGRLRVIEPERLELSNLNRYKLARRSDCRRLKIDVLGRVSLPGLAIDGEPDHLDEESLDRIGPLRERVVVGVDDIPSRWVAQKAAPEWLCVAGTSHLFALVTTHPPGKPCAGCAHPRDDDFQGPIPTISFVSFWAGLLQARALLAEAAGITSHPAAINVSPFGLDGPRALQKGGVAANVSCPVGCSASVAAAQPEEVP